MSAIDLYLFDLDGTLVDSVPDLAAAVDATLRHYHLPVAGVDAVRQWVGNGSRVLIERALQANRWCGSPSLSADAIDEVHRHFLREYEQTFCQLTQLFPGVVDTLVQLQQRGAALAVVSNKPVQFIPPLLQHLHIDSFFQLTLGGDSLPHKKPDPLPLLHCCEQLQIATANTLMVGDSIHDIVAAKAARIKVAAVDYGYNHGEPVAAGQPDFILTSFTQLTGVTW